MSLRPDAMAERVTEPSVYAATLRELVGLTDSSIIGDLADSKCLAKARELAASLPAAIAVSFGFERSLQTECPGVDFAINLSSSGLEWLNRTRRWPHVSVVVNKWRQPWASGSGLVWLEFDLSRDTSIDRAPNVFLAFDRVTGGFGEHGGEVSALIDEYFSESGNCAQAKTLKRCIERAPSAVLRLQLGLMFARHTPPIRLCLQPIGDEELIDFLKAISWPGSLTVAARSVATYRSVCDGFGLHLDVAESINPCAGLELLYREKAQESQPAQERRWIDLFDRLITDGLCSEAVRDKLLIWASKRVFEAPLIERLIAGAFPADEVLLHGTFYTGLAHVKLSLDREGKLSAKAYFGARLVGSSNLECS
jgi:hypothetical protein